MVAVRRAERFLGPDDDWVEEDRRIFAEAAQRLFGRWHTFVREKGHSDYVYTAKHKPDTVEWALVRGGYQRNLLSTRKYRTHHSGGKQWAVGSYVRDPTDSIWQHHVYLFEHDDGSTDIYAHKELSVREGMSHVTDTQQTHGDPNGWLKSVLDASNLNYYTINYE